jgi:hypothetical protein
MYCNHLGGFLICTKTVDALSERKIGKDVRIKVGGTQLKLEIYFEWDNSRLFVFPRRKTYTAEGYDRYIFLRERDIEYVEQILKELADMIGVDSSKIVVGERPPFK